MNRRLMITAVATAGLALLAGCSSSGGSGLSGPAHDAADVTFATQMIPHHRQAVEMADLAIDRSTDAKVVSLAHDIKDAQDPEITTMSGWLEDWHEGVPATAAPMAGMASGGMASVGSASGGSASGGSASGGMSAGMMTDAEMTRLDHTTGAAFDRLWVTMMTTHHRGALTMARTEIASGEYGPAVTLARSIVRTQSAQLSELATLQKTLQK